MPSKRFVYKAGKPKPMGGSGSRTGRVGSVGGGLKRPQSAPGRVQSTMGKVRAKIAPAMSRAQAKMPSGSVRFDAPRLPGGPLIPGPNPNGPPPIRRPQPPVKGDGQAYPMPRPGMARKAPPVSVPKSPGTIKLASAAPPRPPRGPAMDAQPLQSSRGRLPVSRT